MKKFVEPIVEVIELPNEDIITYSGGPNGPCDDFETKIESIFGASAPGKNGVRFD